MADTKISLLTELTDPVSGDWIPIVDTSAGVTKKLDYSLVAPIYNVLSYGADNTGATDTALACQSALDDARDAGGGTVYFPAGTYLIGLLSDNGQTASAKIKGGLKVGDNVTVKGDGWGTVIKTSIEDFPAATWQKMTSFINDDFTGNSNIVIRDLKVDGNRAARAGAGASDASEQEGMDFSTVTNLKILYVWVYESERDAIDLDGCFDVQVNGCMVTWDAASSGWNGLHLGSSTDRVVVTNNYFVNCGLARYGTFPTDAGAVDFAGNDITVANNKMLSCKRGVIANSGAARGVIQGNLITNTGTGVYSIENYGVYINIIGNSLYTVTSGLGILVSTGSQGSNVIGNTVRMSNNGIISSAANCVIKGNVIRSQTSLNAIKCSGASPIIMGNTIESKPSNGARGAIEISSAATGAIVSGNSIGGTQAGHAILCQGDNSIISNNVIPTASSSGYEIDITADNCIAEGNRVAAASTDAFLVTGTKDLIHGNVLVGSTATAASADSIDVTGATTPTVVNNTI